MLSLVCKLFCTSSTTVSVSAPFSCIIQYVLESFCHRVVTHHLNISILQGSHTSIADNQLLTGTIFQICTTSIADNQLLAGTILQISTTSIAGNQILAATILQISHTSFAGNYNSLIQRYTDQLIKLGGGGSLLIIHSISALGIANYSCCTADLSDHIVQGFFRQRTDQRTIDSRILNDDSTLNHSDLIGNAEISHGYECLFARKQVALLGHCLSSVLVAIEGSGHLLIVYPLVANELQVVITLSCLQILIGGIDEFICQLVLLLQGGISQRGIDGGLLKIRAFLSAEGGFKIVSRL